jgi:hypothetical protein
MTDPKRTIQPEAVMAETDIVEMLKKRAACSDFAEHMQDGVSKRRLLLNRQMDIEAAAEIERLRAELEGLRGALEKIAGGYVSEEIPDEDWHGLAAALQAIARAALNQRIAP